MRSAEKSRDSVVEYIRRCVMHDNAVWYCATG